MPTTVHRPCFMTGSTDSEVYRCLPASSTNLDASQAARCLQHQGGAPALKMGRGRVVLVEGGSDRCMQCTTMGTITRCVLLRLR